MSSIQINSIVIGICFCRPVPVYGMHGYRRKQTKPMTFMNDEWMPCSMKNEHKRLGSFFDDSWRIFCSLLSAQGCIFGMFLLARLATGYWFQFFETIARRRELTWVLTRCNSSLTRHTSAPWPRRMHGQRVFSTRLLRVDNNQSRQKHLQFVFQPFPSLCYLCCPFLVLCGCACCFLHAANIDLCHCGFVFDYR